ncbi:MAG: arginine--tRNA ligase [Oscillospiraceae bacterium]|jgi:arginyl-tRNA synthetase|nr:arginine--tRNA ligase [Oscillospiraceae bacterium]
MNIKRQLTNIFADAFERAGYAAEFGTVIVSDRPDLCQFQCNGALTAAKQRKANPMDVAAAVAGKLTERERGILTVEIARPGFLNISADGALLSARVNTLADDDRLCLPKADAARTIVFDYGGPTIGKPLHVGHLRSAVIGDAMYRIAEFLGHRVISDVHLGDWGLPMGLCIQWIIENGITEFGNDELKIIYPGASAKAKEDAEFAAKAQEVTRELQQGNEQYRAIWLQIRDISVADAKANYDALNVRDFDYWYGESTAQSDVGEVVARLDELGLLKDSGGAKIVELQRDDDKEPMPPIIILKSGGGELYSTTDLAAIIQRERDFAPDEYRYLTDQRQILHFKQVFRTARLAGFSSAEFTHIAFGTVNGADGKPFKTRTGGAMQLSDMLADVREILPDAKVATAAIRIADLQNQPSRDYKFELDKFTAAEGKTGPYLLYTAVRIGSVLMKAAEVGAEAGDYIAPESAKERALVIALDSAGEAILKAFSLNIPSAVCDCLFDIAGKFNEFYAEHRILSERDEVRRASWLRLLSVTRRTLIILLELLGVEVPERM